MTEDGMVGWSVLGQKGGRPGLKEELDMPGSQQVLSRPYETPRREGSTVFLAPCTAPGWHRVGYQ